MVGVMPRKIKQTLAGVCLQGSTISNRQASLKEALINDIIEKIKGIPIHLLTAFIVTDQSPALIG